MKKAIALLLALVFALALVSCGSNGSAPNNTPAASSASSAPADSAPADSAPASSETPASYNGGSASFIIHTTANEGTTNAKALDFFADRVEELTGGHVTFTRYYAGTLCSQPETLNYLSTKAIDIAFLGTNIYPADLPLANFPGTIFATGGSQYAVDYGNYMFLDNPESSALIQGEAEANGIHYLCVIASGANTFVSKNPIETLADLNGLRLGTAANYTAFESIGTTVIETFPQDMYDSFQRGVIDCSEMSLSAAVRLMWYEVAPYYALNGTFGWGQPITINIDRWNECSEELQTVMLQAARETGAYTAKLDDESIKQSAATLKDNGTDLVTLPDEDCARWGEAMFDLAITDARTLAEGKDYAADLDTIQGIAADYLGVELPAK